MSVLRDLRDTNNNTDTKSTAKQQAKLLKANLGACGQQRMGSEGDINQNLMVMNGGHSRPDTNNNSKSNRNSETTGEEENDTTSFHFLRLVAANRSGEQQKLILATTTTKTASTPLSINKIMLNGNGAEISGAPSDGKETDFLASSSESHHLLQNPLSRHANLLSDTLCSSKC